MDHGKLGLYLDGENDFYILSHVHLVLKLEPFQTDAISIYQGAFLPTDSCTYISKPELWL